MAPSLSISKWNPANSIPKTSGDSIASSIGTNSGVRCKTAKCVIAGGLPKNSPFARLRHTGVEKIGASRSAALQSVNPLISATIAIVVLRETTTLLIILGTLLVVVGIVLVSWKSEQQLPSFRRWHLLLPLGAACLTGINHPIRRYVLTMANEPLFFSALMGTVSLICFSLYSVVSADSRRLVWHRQGTFPFLATGLFETVSIVCIITAIIICDVVVIAPIAASYPVWSLVEARIFLRDVEPVNWKTVIGTLSVVAGNISIHLGK